MLQIIIRQRRSSSSITERAGNRFWAQCWLLRQQKPILLNCNLSQEFWYLRAHWVQTKRFFPGMPQLFKPSADTILRLFLVGGLLLPVGSLWFFEMMQRSTYYSQREIVHAQPIPFSHEHHVGGLGIDCRYCHTSVEVSGFAGMPPTKTCMNCHAQIWTNADLLRPVRESYRSGQPIHWTRVYDLPDYVYFDHSIHIHKGIGCSDCHGPVDRMPLMYPAATLQMEWCLNCHREPEKFLRPADEVFDMRYNRPSERYPVTVNGKTFTDQLKLGSYLKEQYYVRSVQDITSCSTCHR